MPVFPPEISRFSLEQVIETHSISSEYPRLPASSPDNRQHKKYNNSRRIQNTRSRSPSASGLRDEAQQVKLLKLGRNKAFKMSKNGRIESDRRIPDLKPKHLYSGKRGNGKTDWR
jgi:nucleolar GTP-binding protein